MKKLMYDRESLINSYIDVLTGRIRLKNQVMVFNSIDKSFSIQSALYELDRNESIISGMLDRIDALPGFMHVLESERVVEFVNNLSDEFIRDVIVRHL